MIIFSYSAQSSGNKNKSNLSIFREIFTKATYCLRYILSSKKTISKEKLKDSLKSNSPNGSTSPSENNEQALSPLKLDLINLKNITGLEFRDECFGTNEERKTVSNNDTINTSSYTAPSRRGSLDDQTMAQYEKLKYESKALPPEQQKQFQEKVIESLKRLKDFININQTESGKGPKKEEIKKIEGHRGTNSEEKEIKNIIITTLDN